MEENTNILVGNRLKAIIEHYSVSIPEFSRMLGYDRADKIYNIVNGKFFPSFEILEAITKKFVDVNIDYLITGKGGMVHFIEAKKYKENGSINKIEESEVEAIKQDGEAVMIPLVSVAAVAGFGNADFSIQKSDVKDYYVVPKFKDRRVDFMIEVAGSSMYPKYSPGDIVACTILRESKFIQWNKVHVIGTIEQGILIKRVKKGTDENQLLLISDNKDYDPFTISTNEITGMAIVIGVIRLE